MATDTITAALRPCKATSSAYFDGALVAEDLAIDLDRMAETAWALATSEAFPEQAQHAFVCLAKLGEMTRDKAKREEERLTTLSGMKGQ